MADIRVPYEYDGRQFEGVLVYDDSVTAKRPAILMQPDWLGVCPHSIEMARDVAGKEYVIMIADMFGAEYANREKSFDDLMKISREVRNDLDFLLGCGTLADKTLTAEANRLGLIESDKRGAIGYCIGGGFALEQARAGADFQGTAVYHVTLPNPVDADAKPDFKGRVILFHGSADPVTPRELVDDLETELTECNADWQIIMYGHAGHSFCDVGIFNDLQRYDEKLCQQSYRMMRDFFTETF